METLGQVRRGEHHLGVQAEGDDLAVTELPRQDAGEQPRTIVGHRASLGASIRSASSRAAPTTRR